MPGIFISYRRDDSAGFAGALMRELDQRFGSDNVFMDIDDIGAGQDFVRALNEALDACDVLLAVIGPQWLNTKDSSGGRRLDDRNDYVRLEVATALRRGIWVIPVVVEGTAMPGANELPEDLRALAVRNAMRISNSAWDHDVGALTDQIRAAMYSPQRSESAGRPLLPANFDPGRLMGGKMAILTAVFLFLGLVSLGIGLYLGARTLSFVSRAQGVQGRVIGLAPNEKGDSYFPVVEFKIAGGRSVTFRSSFGSSPPAHEVGEAVPVLYDPRQPSNATIRSFFVLWGPALGLVFFGAVFGAIGLGLLIYALIRGRRQRYLIRTGRPIMSEFHEVEVNTKLRFNQQHPYRVVTKWRNPVSDEIVYFRSNNVWDDPTMYVKNRSITVIVDPNNFSRYVMDLSLLSERAGARA
jgi:uncharacterized protein DUF3592/TIR domain-containing protein